MDSRTRNLLYKFSNTMVPSDRVEIIKYFNEKKIDRILRKRSFGLYDFHNSQKFRLLPLISNDQVKFDCLKYPNKYKMRIYSFEVTDLLATLSDKEKLKLIKEDNYHDITLDCYRKCDLALSLSDKEKIYYLNNASELTDLFFGSIKKFFKSFSKETTREILINRDSYDYKIGSDELVFLINNLDVVEKLQFLNSSNIYNINLNDEQKSHIIASLPIQYKLEILKNSNSYGLSLNEESIKYIIKKMSVSNIINLLIFDEKSNINLSNKSIWNIIESLDRTDAINILESKDEKIKVFVQKYKTSFVKCLNYDEKLDIICNKSKYDIHLDDMRKIKIINSIGRYSSIEYLENIVTYFDDKNVLMDYYINNKFNFSNLHELFQRSIVAFYMNTDINDDDTEIGINIFKNMENGSELLKRYNILKSFFAKLDINFYDFVQYGINSNKYNWYKDIFDIVDNDKLENFQEVKDYFFNNYYGIKNDSKYIVQNFLEILKSYNKYEELCNGLAFKNRKMTTENKEDIRFLFNISSTKIPNNIEEIDSIRKEVIKSYETIAKSSGSITVLKDSLTRLLFDKSLREMTDIIDYTGGMAELKIVEFNNRNNTQISSIIEKLVLATSLIELIINNNDIDELRKILLFYVDENNIEHTKKIFNFCSKYEEYNRKLYEFDFKASLTNIDRINNALLLTEKAKKMKQKYGGEVIDLSESQYLLGAHVMSSKENIENILTGTCDGKSNFICLSPISHRGQHYYYGYSRDAVVFAYDRIKDDSFICSSISNMGSNGVLTYNSSEVCQLTRTQKGILETSEASTGNNAEILLYRAGLKPCGIIVPTGYKPSDKAIEYHKKYNLPFIITQRNDMTIENPLKINKENIKLNDDEFSNIEALNELNNDLLMFTRRNGRKIAILTDPHALYEPTLACFVDIKKRGIDEIYSLGDNIGHGPSPREVLELLDKNGVKSVYGNHEIYITDENGIESLREHFPSDESISRTIEMAKWIKIQLTSEQLESMKLYKERYEINIPTDKKLVLIHTDRPYSTSGKYSKAPEFDDNSYIIKGHEHFASKGANSLTLRGVGIGQGRDDDGMASYCIVSILNDDYNIEIINIPYDRSNLIHTINESDMPVSAKELIKSWVSGK